MISTTERDVIAAALANGYRNAAVTRQRVKLQAEGFENVGAWFVLSVDRGTGLEVIGRRQTLKELQQLAQRRVRFDVITTPKGDKAKNIRAAE